MSEWLLFPFRFAVFFSSLYAVQNYMDLSSSLNSPKHSHVCRILSRHNEVNAWEKYMYMYLLGD